MDLSIVTNIPSKGYPGTFSYLKQSLMILLSCFTLSGNEHEIRDRKLLDHFAFYSTFDLFQETLLQDLISDILYQKHLLGNEYFFTISLTTRFNMANRIYKKYFWVFFEYLRRNSGSTSTHFLHHHNIVPWHLRAVLLILLKCIY